MNISAPFIARPVATTLLTLAIAMAGILGFSKLPVSPLPQVDFPTITVIAQLPGASPNTVATSVAEPLERAKCCFIDSQCVIQTAEVAQFIR